MSLQKRMLLITSTAVIFLVFINNAIILRGSISVKPRSESSKNDNNKYTKVQLIYPAEKKLETTTTLRADSPKPNDVLESHEVKLQNLDSNSNNVNKNSIPYVVVKNTMGFLENKTFEWAKDFIKGAINSVTSNRIMHTNNQSSSSPPKSENTSEAEITASFVTSINANGPLKTSENIPRTVKIGSSETSSNKNETKDARKEEISEEEHIRTQELIRTQKLIRTHDSSPSSMSVITKTNPWLQTQDLPCVGRLQAPLLSVPPSARIYYNTSWHGYPRPILTFKPLGRLGNCMGAYATLWALSKIYNTTVFLQSDSEEVLRPAFPHLSMTPLPVKFVGGSWLYIGRESHNLTDYTPLQEAAAGLKGPRAIVVDEYPIEMQIFNAFRDDIVQEFTFSSSLRQQAQKHLHSVAATMNRPTEFVGVHIRATDMITAVKRLHHLEMPGRAYLMRALSFYRTRLPTVVFVVASDDLDYALKLLEGEPDVFLAPGTPRELDMAILTECNHTVLTLGSFGFWAGYLAGGTVVHPDVPESAWGNLFSASYYQRANLTQFIPIPAY